jgi:hypothetical protein
MMSATPMKPIGITPIETPAREALFLLMEGCSSYHGDPEWIGNLHRAIVSFLTKARIFNYSVQDVPSTTPGYLHRMYTLIPISTRVH